MSYRPITCIGSRKLPVWEYQRLRQLARDLAAAGYTIRSGAAKGADSAFESGLTHDKPREIYLPRKKLQRVTIAPNLHRPTRLRDRSRASPCLGSLFAVRSTCTRPQRSPSAWAASRCAEFVRRVLDTLRRLRRRHLAGPARRCDVWRAGLQPRTRRRRASAARAVARLCKRTNRC